MIEKHNKQVSQLIQGQHMLLQDLRAATARAEILLHDMEKLYIIKDDNTDER